MEQWLLPSGYALHPAWYVIVALLAFLMTGVSKGGFGGVGILAIPLMMLVAPTGFALGMWLPLLILCDICTLKAYPKEWKARPILLLAPWTLVGLGVGWKLLDHVEPHMVKLFVGVLAVGFVVLEVVRGQLLKRISVRGEGRGWRPTVVTAAPFGVSAGISTMIAHAAGAITTIYFLPQRFDKRTFVGTTARFYFVLNSIKVPLLVDVDYITRETLVKSLWLVPLAPITVWFGSWLNRRLTATRFNKIIYALLGISGIYLVYDNGLKGMLGN